MAIENSDTICDFPDGSQWQEFYTPPPKNTRLVAIAGTHCFGNNGNPNACPNEDCRNRQICLGRAQKLIRVSDNTSIK
jgi:hypothetical protein